MGPVVVLFLLLKFTLGNIVTPKLLTESSDDYILRKWYQMEDTLENSADMLVKKLLPKLNDISSRVNLSQECNAALFKLILDFKHLKMWALQMIDSSGKPTSGILDGALVSMGDYEQCLKIKVNKDQTSEESFRGQYCLVEFKPPLPKKRKSYYYRGELVQPFINFTPRTQLFRSFKYKIASLYAHGMRFGLCFPSACTMDDVTSIINTISSSVQMNGVVVSCKTRQRITMDYAIVTVISVLVTFLLIVLVCTFIDVYFKDENANIYVEAFSLKRNLQRALRFEKRLDASDISHFHGVRFFSMVWVVLGHAAYGFHPYKTRFASTISTKVVGNFWLQFVVNGFLSVDSFFFLSAVLSAYWFTKSLDKYRKTAFNCPIQILRRVFRLLPGVMLVLGLQLLMYPLNDGPYWDEILRDSQLCKSRWWTVLTFTHNLQDICETCLVHVWYVSTAMQYFCLSMVYFYLLLRHPMLSNVYLLLLFLTTPIVNVTLSLWYNFPPTLYSAMAVRKDLCRFMQYIYVYPHAHVAVHAMGLLAGNLLARKKELFDFKTVYKVLGWIVFAILIGLTLYGPYTWHQVHSTGPSSKFESAFQNGFQRIGWGLALTWLTFQCATGNAGVINTFLSWKIFAILNRPSYMVYLVHVLSTKFFFTSLYGPADADPNTLVMRFFGNLLFSYIIAFILHVIYESPLIQFDKIWFNFNLKKNKQLDPPQLTFETRKSVQEDNNNANFNLSDHKMPKMNSDIKLDSTNL